MSAAGELRGESVGKALSTLSEEEVGQITTLVESLDRSTFDFLQVEVGDLKVTIGKGAPPASVPSAPVAVQPAPAQGSAPAQVAPVAAAETPAAGRAAASVAGSATSEGAADGTVAIAAPMMGRYYAKPEPGAEPFVKVGDAVNADTTVGLIEVMKVFTAVPAGVSGVITEICVQDTEFVEYAQTLFRVRPA